MASSPDLFVVCKTCGSEVSPYVTECPYCGSRLRKRAPKLDRGGVPREPKASRTGRPQLSRLRPNEIPGIRADHRPWATWVLVGAAIIVTLLLNVGVLTLDQVGYGQGATEPWRALTTLFTYTHDAYELLTLGAVALFGWLLERRHGPWAPIAVFLIAGAGGALAGVAAGDDAALGANGGALGLLAAWSVRDLLKRRGGMEDDADLLGVLAIAVVLVLLPLASADAGRVTGLAGGVIGLVLGLGLARLPER